MMSNELSGELVALEYQDIDKILLAKGYVKVQWKQWNDGELIKSDVKFYQPGSKDLMAAIAEAVENWKNMWGTQNLKIDVIDLFAKNGTILKLSTRDSDAYEIWEIL